MSDLLNIPYEELAELVERLPAKQRHDLLHRLQQRENEDDLSVDEKMRRLRAAQIRGKVNQQPSLSREDWYGDDGR